MKLLAAGVLLYGLWAVARCSDPGTPASELVTFSNDTNTTVSPPVTITTPPAPPQPTPANMTTAPTNATTPQPTPANMTTVTTPLPTVPVTNATTVTPSTAVPPTAVPPPERHFDTLSFLGGIILTLGCLAICYVGFKFYKARTERNYHTL
uniref:Putative secreted protein n=1 Tax=Amblyomma americanum TaxID=6943 RepID=A0A0C9SF36_AMBAM